MLISSILEEAFYLENFLNSREYSEKIKMEDVARRKQYAKIIRECLNPSKP